MLRELSADEKLRQQVYYREKRLHDEASALNGARREGIEIGLVQGRAEGRTEGIEIGLVKGKAEGKAEGLAEGSMKKQNELIAKMRRLGMSEEDISKIISDD